MVDRQSPHRLTTKYGTVSTQCAVDALGIPAAIGIAARISDSCARCGRTIEATVTEGGDVAVQPTDTVVSMAAASQLRADSDLPTMRAETNFFCRFGHAEAWQEDHATLPAAVISPAECVTAGLAMWQDLASGSTRNGPPT